MYTVVVMEWSPTALVTELIDGKLRVAVFGRMPDGDVHCRLCKKGRLEQWENARDGGIFYGCSNYPYCNYTRNLR